ncbi:MAG: heavy metal-binding domain-containing protein [Candidatus Caldatribacteriota bacterium]
MKIQIIFFIILAFFSFGCNKVETSQTSAEGAHGEANHSYYTCPMHPQVHDHEPGNCAMCGMPLVKVTEGQETKKDANVLLPSDYQVKVLQLTKGKVEKREVSFEIPAGGRHLSSSQVAFYIYERDLMRVKVGQEFEGECASMPGMTLRGKITQIDTVADPSSRSVRVLGRITDPHDMNLLEGSFFGNIKTTPVKTLLIPYDAVLRTGKKDLVYKVLEDGGLKVVPVTVGMTIDDEIEILDGLEEGELISFGPNFLLDSESRLRGIHD